MFKFLSHKIHLALPDPLGGGLAEEIAAEQAEPEAIVLDEELNESLADSWQQVIDEFKDDPEYIDLMKSMDE